MALPTPVAYWPFNEGTGTTAADASGNGHTATLVHGTWNTSLRIFGAAALANTAGGNGATFTPINLGTVHSIAYWMNGWDGTSLGIPLGGTDSYAGYLDGGNIHYYAVPSDVTKPHGVLTGIHHLVITRTGTTITFYKDGISLGTATLGSSAALTLSVVSGWPGGVPFIGTLDDVRLYDVALTGAQVTELYALNPDPAATLAIVQATPQAATGPAASVAVTFATPPPVGRGIVVAVASKPAAATVATVTDTAGNAYTLAKTQTHGTGDVAVHVWYCAATTATATPVTVTATGAAGGSRLAVALEVSGGGVGLLLDQAASVADAGGFTHTVTTAALAGPEALLVAASSYGGSGAITVGVTTPPQWTSWAELVALNPVTAEIDTRLLPGALGLTASVTWGTGAALFGALAIVAFRPGAPIPPPVDGPPVYVVSIGEVEVVPLLSTFRIQETIDAPDTMIADVFSVAPPSTYQARVLADGASAYWPLDDPTGSTTARDLAGSAGAGPFLRFALGQAVVVTEDGVRIFGGVVTGLRERGLTGPSATDLVVEIQATSYEINAARRVITAAYSQDSAETIGAAFASLVTDYYAEVDVTLHPGQVAGPALPAATFTRSRGDAVNKQLAASVGYLQSIDFDNRLRAWAPGDIAAPFDYDEAGNPEILVGDITVERQLQNGYANRVILVGDPIPVPGHVDHFTGDGVTNVWPVTYKVNGPYPYFVDGAVAQGVIQYPATSTTESIGGVESPPGFLWEYDPIALTIHRRSGPVAAGVAFDFPYDGLFIPAGMAEDAAEIAALGLWEHVENVTAVITDASAQDYADALLAAKVASKDEIVRLQTNELGYHPGQTMTIASFSRLLAGEYLITQVDTGADGSTRLRRSITASKSQNNTHDWRRVYQQWAGASANTGTE